MKFTAVSLFLLGSIVASGVAYADADDAKWVAKCVADNSDAKASPDVVKKYCSCMNDKMSSNETQTISQWEKSHPKEMAACEKEAGWK